MGYDATTVYSLANGDLAKDIQLTTQTPYADLLASLQLRIPQSSNLSNNDLLLLNID